MAAQNYHYQQMNGNQLVSHSTNCNCIKLKYCSPVMEMARKMYTGFIANYINSQLQVMACNYIDGEMEVCCPKHQGTIYSDSREKRGNGLEHGHWNHDKSWTWDTDDTHNSEELTDPTPTQYPMNMFTSFPIQSFYPFSPPNVKTSKYSFYANHEDPSSHKNCPEPFSNEFSLPKNHTFFKEQVDVTTPVSRLELATTQAPEPITEAPQKADPPNQTSLINDEACGRSVGSRITGGQDAGVGRFSWMGRLAYRNKSWFNLKSFLAT